jgi:hypothetical protein
VRRRVVDENEVDESVKVNRKAYDVSCENYGQEGNKARSGTQLDNLNKRKWPKRDRKPKSNTEVDLSSIH